MIEPYAEEGFVRGCKDFLVLIFLLASANTSMAQTTLKYPYATRSLGMGGTGYALADDETALFFNPAGLAIPNYRWNGGAATVFREFPAENNSVLDEVKIVTTNFTLAYQNERLKNAGFGASVCRLTWPHSLEGPYSYTLPENDTLDLSGYHPYQMTATLGGGYTFFANLPVTHSLGFSAKFYHAADYYRPYTRWGNTNDTAMPPAVNTELVNGVSFDAAYLLNVFNRLKVGLTFKDMGPALKYSTRPAGYESASNQSRILAAGIAYKNDFGTPRTTILDLANEISYSRSGWKQQYDSVYFSVIERSFATGTELLILRTFALRFGYNYLRTVSESPTLLNGSAVSYSHDDAINYTSRQDVWRISFGTGIRLFNHIEADVYTLENHAASEDDYVSPMHRVGVSLSLTRALAWRKSDLQWWRRELQ